MRRSFVASLLRMTKGLGNFNPLCQMANIKKGFTLVELLLYMGLLAIFLVVLTEIFVTIMEVRLESEATSSVEQDGRFMVSRFAYDISRASAITTPANLGDTTSLLVMTVGGDTFRYAVSGGNLELTNANGTDNLNSSQSTISNQSFQKIGNSGGAETIKILFTVSSITQRAGGAETKMFETTVGRR